MKANIHTPFCYRSQLVQQYLVVVLLSCLCKVHKTVWRLKQAKAKRVAIQFPEGLLMYSCVIADILERYIKAHLLHACSNSKVLHTPSYPHQTGKAAIRPHVCIYRPWQQTSSLCY